MAYQQERRYRPFDAQAAASSLVRAADALDNNYEEAANRIIELVAYSSWQDRRVMVSTAQGMGRDVVKEVRRKTKGDFQKGLMALLLPAPVRDADWIRDAITGIMKKKNVAREILCTRTPTQLRAISESYSLKYGKDMIADVLGTFGGKERKLYERLLTVDRLEGNYVDRDHARSIAQSLYAAGPAKWGTDEGPYMDLMATEGTETVRAVFREYETLYGQSLFTVMDKEFRGGLEKDLLTLGKFVVEPAKAFADMIHKGCKGLGTDEEQLIRAIIARKDIDLREIKDVYEAQHGSLIDTVRSETSGDFRNLLLAVIDSVAY
ncbi:hypothetical protein CBR_g4461 [Chara braunii]|uniref:Annexin n=1 Tax=Chara braunii TaxID=69332 RepID=A0A388KHV7_CHABU|nr:hypothetical protein CBR_g4461 [Chara braunii]|eukprot:GBG69631.1 hypothetical protein CBR_g4461 [Chara braunii]